MSITEPDFIQACQHFQSCWQAHIANNQSWLAVKVLENFNTKYLRIVKSFRLASESDEVSNEDSLAEDGDEMIEEDQETLERPSGSEEGISINYDIVHSPTYQVPVLYITSQQPARGAMASAGAATPSSLDAVYQLLVPASAQAQVKDVGVMGALSMTDHPISGLPAYFVHPCRTAEVMGELFGGPGDGASTEWEVYLLIWIGLIGGSVGLDVPARLAESIMRSGEGAMED